MLRVSVIGIGNAGGQVADLAAENESIKAIAINASESDLKAIKRIPSVLVGDRRGAGKNRDTAKEFIRRDASHVLEKEEVKNVLNDADVLFVVSSTGGGTGSGMNPVLSELLSHIYKGLTVITIGIIPQLTESPAAQQNTAEFLKEINSNKNLTFMLFDNGKFEGNPNTVLKTVNEAIVSDINAVTGMHQDQTDLSSIDERDALRIFATPGRLVGGHVSNIREKDIDKQSMEEQLIRAIRDGAHAELETDRIVRRRGLITRMNSNLMDSFDLNLPKFKSSFGEPLETFEHNTIDDTKESLVYVFMSGLSIPDDRIIKIKQRIEEATSLMTHRKESSVLDDMDTSSMKEMRVEKQYYANDEEREVLSDTGSSNGVVDLDFIFGKYNL